MKITTIDNSQRFMFTSQNAQLGVFGFKRYRGAELERYPGIAHLCEHLMCRAWDDFDDYFVQRCIEKNASTANLAVSYYFAGLDEFLPEIVESIIFRPGERSVLNWVPSEEQFERERRVVIQEYEGYMSNPFNALMVNLGRRFFNWNGPIGRLDVIKETTYSQFLDEFEEQRKFDTFAYSGSHVAEIDTVLNKHAAQSPRIDIESVHPYRSLCEYKATEIEYYAKSSQQTIIGDWIEIDDSVAPWEIMIISSMFDDGMHSPLMKELRQKAGLAYAAQCFHAASTLPVLMSYVSVNPENVERARGILHDTYVNWQDSITRERFNSVISGLHNRNKLREARNYNPSTLLSLTNPSETEASTTNVDSLTYERVCEILERFFKRENIRVAEVGDEIKI